MQSPNSFSSFSSSHSFTNNSNSSERKRPHSDSEIAPSPIMSGNENTPNTSKRPSPTLEQRSGNSILARLPLVTSPSVLSRKSMQMYLSAPEKYGCELTISYPKIAQKSYKNEKRFFCPPPLVRLSGEGWKWKRSQVDRLYKQGKANMINSGGLDKDRIDEDQASKLCAFIDIGSSEQEPVSLNFNNQDQCAVRTLLISDSDKRKYFELSLRLFYGCGIDVGRFTTSRIKVISKPSKKKQSMKSTDCKFLCVTSGTKVALFKRTRSQTMTTRYLYVDNNQFTASATQWGSFTIHLCEEDDGDDPKKFIAKDGYVHYGSVIKLVDTVSGISLPKLRIRKVNDLHVLLEEQSEEPVSQLHKCAFQIVGREMTYLCLSHDKIVTQQAASVPNQPMCHQITDMAIWTIVSTDTKEFRFCEANGLVRAPLSPTPTLSSFEVVGPEGLRRLELSGHCFLPNLKVWLHTVELNTVIRSNELAVAVIPSANEMMTMCPEFGESIAEKQLSISFVRDDGVIYGTPFTFSYR